MTNNNAELGNALIVNLNEHYQLNKQAQIKNRHIQLLKLADELIFRKGYSQFRLDMLCELSGCSRGTLYKSFNTKDSLLTDLASEVFSLWLYLSKKVLDSNLLPRNKVRGILIAKKICKCLFPSGINAIYFNVMKQELEGRDDTQSRMFKNKENFFITEIEQLFNTAISVGDLIVDANSLALMMHYLWKSIYLDETVVYRMTGQNINAVEDINIDLFTSFLDLIKFRADSKPEVDLTVDEYMKTFFVYENELIRHKTNSSKS